MAKKFQTPEEVQASLEKKEQSRKLFFGTFTKSLAFFLAIAICFSLAAIAFTKPAPVAQSTPVQGNSGSSSSDEDPFADGDSSSSSSSTDADKPADDKTDADKPADNGDKPADNGAKPAELSQADAIKLLNEETAKASKGDYKFNRDAKFTQSIEVGGPTVTKVLNGIIGGVVKNDDWPGNDNWGVNEVVGDFIGVVPSGKLPIRGVVKGGTLAERDDKDTTTKNKNYCMKAMTLTDDDISGFKTNGTVIQFNIKDSDTPQRDNKTPLSHATNDFLTQDEVDAALKSAVGDAVGFNPKEQSTVKYTNIKVVAKVADGKLTELTISYNFAADLYLKAGIGVHGTGAAAAKTKFVDIKY